MRYYWGGAIDGFRNILGMEHEGDDESRTSRFINLHSYQYRVLFVSYSYQYSVVCFVSVGWREIALCYVISWKVTSSYVYSQLGYHFVVGFFFQGFPPHFSVELSAFFLFICRNLLYFWDISTWLHKHARDFFFHHLICVFFLSDELKSFIFI